MGRDKDFVVGTLDATTLKLGGTSGPSGSAGTAVTATAAEINASVAGLTATAAEINQLDASANISKMAASTVMAATVETYKVSTLRTGNIIKTNIYVDLTGAKSTTTDLDIIGNTGVCHIGQVTAAVNGLIYFGRMSCAEVPATGADDIDLYTASVGTGAYDADASALTNAAALVTAGGAWAVNGVPKPFIAAPADNYYLYLANGEAGTVGTYTAGKLIIEMWGLAV